CLCRPSSCAAVSRFAEAGRRIAALVHHRKDTRAGAGVGRNGQRATWHWVGTHALGCPASWIALSNSAADQGGLRSEEHIQSRQNRGSRFRSGVQAAANAQGAGKAIVCFVAALATERNVSRSGPLQWVRGVPERIAGAANVPDFSSDARRGGDAARQ